MNTFNDPWSSANQFERRVFELETELDLQKMRANFFEQENAALKAELAKLELTIKELSHLINNPLTPPKQ